MPGRVVNGTIDGVVSKVFGEGIRDVAPNYCRQTQCENLTTFKKCQIWHPSQTLFGTLWINFKRQTPKYQKDQVLGADTRQMCHAEA